jgi:hypothetical protein
MSELTLSLILLGSLVLMAVWAHGQWRVWRSKPRLPKSVGSDKNEASIAKVSGKGQGSQYASVDSRIEPVFEAPSKTADVEQAFNHQGNYQENREGKTEAETHIDSPHSVPDAEMSEQDTDAEFADSTFGHLNQSLSATALGLNAATALDGLIDSIAHIALEQAVSGALAVAALPSTRRLGSKAFAIEGLNEKTREWQRVQATERYSAFQAGVQLANRSGALNEIEFSEFVQRTNAFADALNGEVDFPDMRVEVGRARELDQFASLHDARLSFCLKAIKTAWSPGYVQQHAAQIGFVLGAVPGRMVLPTNDPYAPPALVLSFDPQAALSEDPSLSALSEIKMSLEVAQVSSHLQAFSLLCTCLQRLADQMQGRVCDEQGQTVEVPALDVIAQDLERLYARLDERDLSAGSPQARRLFS